MLADRRLLAWSVTILAAVTVLFALHGVIHYEPSVVALLGAGAMLLVTCRSPATYCGRSSGARWCSSSGLFVMVGALVKVGVIGSIAQWLAGLIDGRLLVGSLLLLAVSAVLSAVVDNIPYVATMAPIVVTVAADLPAATDATRCGGPSPWAPTSAGTRRRSAPART